MLSSLNVSSWFMLTKARWASHCWSPHFPDQKTEVERGQRVCSRSYRQRRKSWGRKPGWCEHQILISILYGQHISVTFKTRASGRWAEFNCWVRLFSVESWVLRGIPLCTSASIPQEALRADWSCRVSPWKLVFIPSLCALSFLGFWGKYPVPLRCPTTFLPGPQVHSISKFSCKAWEPQMEIDGPVSQGKAADGNPDH